MDQLETDVMEVPFDRDFGTEWNDTDLATKIDIVATAFGIVLHRYSGQEFIKFGVVHDSVTQNLIFKISIDFYDGMTFGNALDQVHIQRNESTQLLSKTEPNLHQSLEKFSIVLGITSTETDIRFVVNFSETRLNSTLVSNLPGHVITILENGLHFLEEQIDKLPMLTSDEQKLVLETYNSNDLKISLEDAPTNLFDVFLKNVVENGKKLALVQELEEDDVRLSYDDLYACVVKLKLALETHLNTDAAKIQNIEQNKFVAIYLPQGAPFVIASLAVLMLNKTVAVLHSSYAKAQVEACLAKLGGPTLITTSDRIQKIDLNYHSTVFINEAVMFENGGNNNLSAKDVTAVRNLYRNDTPYCFFTSGSTGVPKAVLVTSDSILNRTLFTAKYMQVDSTLRAMFIVPPGFLPVLCDIWVTFVAGGSLHIPSEATRLDLQKLKIFIYQHEITSFFASNIVTRDLVAGKGDAHLFSKLKWIHFGGERMENLNLFEKNFGCVYEYGSTETFAICTKIYRGGQNYEFPSVGPPISNVSVYILDNHCQPVPIGVTGDIYVSGAGLMAGYVGKDIAQPMLPNPFQPGSKMYRTGDVGFWNNGEVTVIGRKDSQVKIHGMRLELGEVEAVLQKFPGIKQAIVVMRKIQKVQQLIAVCLVKNLENTPMLKELNAFLHERLQHHAIPAEIHFVSEFYKTASGKIDRNATAARFLKTEVSKSSALLNKVRQCWASVIGIPEDFIREESDFFTIGGNSIHASLLTNSLQEEFPALELSNIFDFSVLSEFVEFLTENSEKQKVDFQREVQLDLTVDLQMDINSLRTIQKSLLTGSTGYFGTALLYQLLASTSQTVVCIVRAKSIKEAEIKLDAAIASHKLTYQFQKFPKSRLEILAGDVSMPKFGLGDETYDSLCETTDAIYHAAADVNHLKSYAQLKNSTVRMTKEVIEFAVKGKLKWIHHMSSVAVFDGVQLPGVDETFHADEDYAFENFDALSMSNGYSQSKWVSEKLVRLAIRKGVPGAIYRLAEIGSHSQLNVVNATDALGGFLTTCNRIGQFPNISYTLPYVGLDFAAKMVVSESEGLLQNPALERKQCFHIIESKIGLLEFCDPMHCELVDLECWEREFKSQFKPDSAGISASVFLNSLKMANRQAQKRRGSVMRHISFEFENKTKLDNNRRTEIVSGYCSKLLKATNELIH